MKLTLLLVIGAISTFATAARAGPQDGAGSAFSDYATLPRGSAVLECNLMEYEAYAMMNARVHGAGPFGFVLYTQAGTSRVFNPYEAVLVGSAPTNAEGEGSMAFPCRLPDLMLGTREVVMFAVYRDAGGALLVARPAPFVLGATRVSVLDFDTNLLGHAIPAGRELRGQWGLVGIQISATNDVPGHPDKALVYDSSDAFGADPDLTTPGAGFLNDRAYGNVLIIAENDLDGDADGLVDRPDDEAGGGVVTFAFSRPVQVYKVVLVDVDMNESARLFCFDGDRLMQDLDVQPMGDNGVERIGLGADRLTRLDVALSGSGAIAELWIIGQGIPDDLFPEYPLPTTP